MYSFIILEERRNDNGILSFTRASVRHRETMLVTWYLFLLQKTLHIVIIVDLFFYILENLRYILLK